MSSSRLRFVKIIMVAPRYQRWPENFVGSGVSPDKFLVINVLHRGVVRRGSLASWESTCMSVIILYHFVRIV